MLWGPTTRALRRLRFCRWGSLCELAMFALFEIMVFEPLTTNRKDLWRGA
jgi:hypothetical protein